MATQEEKATLPGAGEQTVKEGLRMATMEYAGAKFAFSAFSPQPTCPAPPGQEYVDPYLFETGHFESRAEYEELSRTAKIKPRARA